MSHSAQELKEDAAVTTERNKKSVRKETCGPWKQKVWREWEDAVLISTVH